MPLFNVPFTARLNIIENIFKTGDDTRVKSTNYLAVGMGIRTAHNGSPVLEYLNPRVGGTQICVDLRPFINDAADFLD